MSAQGARRALDQALGGWLALALVVGLLIAEGCGVSITSGPAEEPFVRWRCKSSPMEGAGDLVVVCRDNLTLDCHAVWRGYQSAASLGVVPCDVSHAVGGGR
mgnify:FL=1